MLPPSIDPTPYLRSPRLTVRSGLSLAKMMLTVVPAQAGPGVLVAAQRLVGCIEALESAWKAQSRPRRGEDPRPVDTRLDRVWGVVASSLERYSIFPADHADRTSALAIHERLFPNGLAFLRLSYPEEHAESQRLVDLVEEEGLRPELDRLVGELFLDELHAAHEAYGEVLGITEPAQPAEPAVTVAEPLRALSDAITAYVIQVLAFEGLDPAKHGELARIALEPIDRLRRAAARRTAAPTRTEAAPAPAPEPDEPELPEGFPEPDAEIPALPTA